MTKDEFAKLYANIPIGERSNPIYVDEKHGAMSWHVVKIESDAETEIGVAARNFIATI